MAMRMRLATRRRTGLIALALLLVAGLLVAACRGVQQTRPASTRRPAMAGPTLAPTVILLSLDGWRWDYHTKTALPHLQRLIDGGVRAEALIPAFPSKTFPNHYSIVTGLYPGHHGVLGNNMVDATIGRRFALWDREQVGNAAWWGGEPLWVTVTRQRRLAGALFWPGSEAAIGGVRPAEWALYDETLSNDRRVDRLLGWLDRPVERRPVLLLTYFSDADDAGHRFGPDSPQLIAALQRVDRAIGRLMAGLDRRHLTDQVNVVLVSDHGMTAASRDRVIVLSDYLDLARVDVVELTPNLAILPTGTSEDDVYRRLHGAHPHLRVYRKAESPEAWRFRSHPRVPPIIGVADDGWTIVRRPLTPTDAVSLGQHGYDPEVTAMRGLFVARGPAFRRGVIVPAFENVHIYDVLSRVLGVEPASNDGDPAIAASLLR